MNQRDLITTLAGKTDLSKRDVSAVIDALVETVQETLSDGDDVRIAGIGIFKPQPRAASEGRNPRTGETIHIAASTVPKFTPAKPLKDALNAPQPKVGAAREQRRA